MTTASLLTSLPGWDTGITNPLRLDEARGSQAREQAARYGAEYRGRRAAMVFDVLASRQRRYPTRVLGMIAGSSRPLTPRA